MNRTTRTIMTFAAPFSIKAIDGFLPAGDYRVMTEDEPIDSLSHIAFRRVATYLTLPAIAASQSQSQLVEVAQVDLDAAMAKDRAFIEPPV